MDTKAGLHYTWEISWCINCHRLQATFNSFIGQKFNYHLLSHEKDVWCSDLSALYVMWPLPFHFAPTFTAIRDGQYFKYMYLKCIFEIQNILITLKKIECILYLNIFNLSIFVFSKYIKYFLPINLFIRLLVSCINKFRHATFMYDSIYNWVMKCSLFL